MTIAMLNIGVKSYWVNQKSGGNSAFWIILCNIKLEEETDAGSCIECVERRFVELFFSNKSLVEQTGKALYHTDIEMDETSNHVTDVE